MRLCFNSDQFNNLYHSESDMNTRTAGKEGSENNDARIEYDEEIDRDNDFGDEEIDCDVDFGDEEIDRDDDFGDEETDYDNDFSNEETDHDNDFGNE